MRHIIADAAAERGGSARPRRRPVLDARGYNIESLSVAPTDDPTVSRLTLVTKGSDAVIQQISISSTPDRCRERRRYDHGEHLERELVLLKLKVRHGQADRIRGLVVRSGGRVLDPAPEDSSLS